MRITPPPSKNALRPRTVLSGVVWRSVKNQLRRHVLAGGLLLIASVGLLVAGVLAVLSLGQLSLHKTLVLRGQLQAIEQAIPVAHHQTGIVKEIFVTEGEWVQEGQVLAILDTSQVATDLETARKEVAKILLRVACLRAQREGAVDFTPSLELKRAMGRLHQHVQLERATRDCRVDLRKLALQRSDNRLAQKTTQDVAHLYQRIAQTKLVTQSGVVIMPDQGAKTPQGTAQLISVFESTVRAKRAQKAAEELSNQLIAAALERHRAIDHQIDRLNDALVLAESYLSTQENLLDQRFVYAIASGRVQRLRIKEGTRLAKGAHFLEIAPVQTDFEVLSNASVMQVNDLTINQGVRVKLSGGLPRPIWVPAKIDSITKLSENKRLISIFLTREDLNKRDLLRGDRTLNGLGEQSEAIVKIKPENALVTLRMILLRFFINWRADATDIKPLQG